jgi:NADH-quinone oxidoreductase subunit L
MAWMGALTALLAALCASVQTDIKKTLAYATASQLGLMFLAAGCGRYSTALFHMGTHAFFMALLLLSAGAVILALHRETDTQKMGGLRHVLPAPYWTFLIGVIAVTGVMPIGGFFSKDAVVVAASASDLPGHAWLYRLAIATAGLTGFYMWRLLSRVFYGRTRVTRSLRERIEEPDGWVSNPLYVLAALTVLAGVVGLPQAWGDLLGVSDSNSLANFVSPVLAPGKFDMLENSRHYELSLRTWAASLAGVGLAHLLYVRRADLSAKLFDLLPTLHRTLARKFYADEFYDATMVRPLLAFSERVLYRRLELKWIDGVGVQGTARAVRALAAYGMKYAQSGSAQSYLCIALVGVVALVGYLVS